MKLPNALYKTTIVIWTNTDPGYFEIDELAREAVCGDAFCSDTEIEYVTDKNMFPDTNFFGVEND